LNTALGLAGKGSFISVPISRQEAAAAGQLTVGAEPQVAIFNRKHMRSAVAKFAKVIGDLNRYFRVSMKKTRAQVDPSLLRGTYTPVYAGPALMTFFTQNPAGFGYLDPERAYAVQQLREAQQGTPAQNGRPAVPARQLTPEEQAYVNQGEGPLLMASLQQVQNGLLLRNTITMLFYVYAHAQGLQFEDGRLARSDDLMNAAFGGQIPAAYYAYRTDSKPRKVLMQLAVTPQAQGGEGLLQQEVNTYSVIAANHPYQVIDKVDPKTGEVVMDPQTNRPVQVEIGFRPEQFNTYFYQNISSLNYFSQAELGRHPEIGAAPGQVAPVQAIAQEAVREQMLNDHNLVKQVSAGWKALLEPGRKVKREQNKRTNDARKKADKAAKAAGGAAAGGR